MIGDLLFRKWVLALNDDKKKKVGEGMSHDFDKSAKRKGRERQAQVNSKTLRRKSPHWHN